MIWRSEGDQEITKNSFESQSNFSKVVVTKALACHFVGSRSGSGPVDRFGSEYQLGASYNVLWCCCEVFRCTSLLSNSLILRFTSLLFRRRQWACCEAPDHVVHHPPTAIFFVPLRRVGKSEACDPKTRCAVRGSSFRSVPSRTVDFANANRELFRSLRRHLVSSKRKECRQKPCGPNSNLAVFEGQKFSFPLQKTVVIFVVSTFQNRS